jgi:hypothetical protein
MLTMLHRTPLCAHAGIGDGVEGSPGQALME